VFDKIPKGKRMFDEKPNCLLSLLLWFGSPIPFIRISGILNLVTPF